MSKTYKLIWVEWKIFNKVISIFRIDIFKKLILGLDSFIRERFGMHSGSIIRINDSITANNANLGIGLLLAILLMLSMCSQEIRQNPWRKRSSFLIFNRNSQEDKQKPS